MARKSGFQQGTSTAAAAMASRPKRLPIDAVYNGIDQNKQVNRSSGNRIEELTGIWITWDPREGPEVYRKLKRRNIRIYK